MMNPNGPEKNRYIVIVSNMIKFPVKDILSANQVRAAGQLYDDKPRKLGGKHQLVTTYGREIRMIYSDVLAYLSVRCPTDEEMESFPKVLFTHTGEWYPIYPKDDGQWEDSDDKVSIGSNVYVTSSSSVHVIDVLEPIMSVPQHKAHTVTFTDGVAFTKGVTDNEFFYESPQLDTLEFNYYNGFSTSLAVGPFGPNHVYAKTRWTIVSISAVTDIVTTVCTVSALVCHYINGLSSRNGPVDVKKLRNLFPFKPDNIFIKALEATTKLGGFNQHLVMW